MFWATLRKGPPTPPPLTMLGRLRVPTNLKASGTTLNRGSGEGVPLKGISHLFKKEQIKPCSWVVFFAEVSQVILSPIVATWTPDLIYFYPVAYVDLWFFSSRSSRSCCMPPTDWIKSSRFRISRLSSVL